MKCDKLQRHSVRGEMYNGEEICGGFAYYDADDVDSAIAELKEAWRSEHEACEALKQKLDEKDNDIAYWREEYDKRN